MYDTNRDFAEGTWNLPRLKHDPPSSPKILIDLEWLEQDWGLLSEIRRAAMSLSTYQRQESSEQQDETNFVW